MPSIRCPGVLRRLLPVAVAAMSVGSPALAVPPASLTSSAYSVSFDDLPVREALRRVAQTFDLRLKLGAALPGRVSGSIKSPSASALLDQLAGQHGFERFVHAGTLHVSDVRASETARLTLAGGASTESAKALLVANRLLEPRFGWIEQPEENAVLIHGPVGYVALVRKALEPVLGAATGPRASEIPKAMPPEVMVFKLRHANAEDRTVTYRQRSVVVPGLATNLRAVMSQSQHAMRPADKGGHVLPPDLAEDAVRATKALPSAMRAAVERPGARTELAPAADATPGVGPTMHRGFVNVVPDGRTNSLLVFDSPERRAFYERLVAELDVEQHLVEIEALIIDIDRRLLAELGVEWSAGGARVGYSGVLNAVSGLTSTTFVIPNIDQFFARLRALDTSGDATILGRPSVLTLDNQAAVLDLSTTDFIRVIGERVADIKEVTAGTSLRVVPRLILSSASSAVQLLVDIEDGTVQSAERGGTPVVQRSTISTQALIEIGQSLVVGGYRASQQRREVNKVPFLGSIPVIGQAFRNTRSEDRNMERLFVITPRTVAGSAMRFAAGAPAPVQGTVKNAADRLSLPLDVFLPAGAAGAVRGPAQAPSPGG